MRSSNEQALALIPEPKSVRVLPGRLQMESPVLKLERGQVRGKKPGYRLVISKSGIKIVASSPEMAWCGVQTLGQIVSQCPDGLLPCLVIRDWPDFANRGVYLDVARGRIPKIERLEQMVDALSFCKINQLQLYIEHTFKFKRHPAIGRGASPLTADDIKRLDQFCADRYVEFVPSLASFGHMSRVLQIKRYRHMAEDWGVGRYVDPLRKCSAHRRGWTISPANPHTYKFIESLYSEFLPLFRSKQVNVCCDETWDMGCGQTAGLCKKKGKGQVYLDHVRKLKQIAGKHGKRIQFWGDMIKGHPELIPGIPKDVTVLDWGYSYSTKFAEMRLFKKAGLSCYVCPGTSSWRSLFPRISDACANIAGFAAEGLRSGAEGLLNTDWGDGGHYNFMELSWHGYLFGAEQAWNTKADQASFNRRFCRLFLRSNHPGLPSAITKLGDISSLYIMPRGYYQSFWQYVFFARPGEDALKRGRENAYISEQGRIRTGKIMCDARLGARTLKALDRVRAVFVEASRAGGSDPMGVLPYWIFAVDTMRHAAKKLTILGPCGRDTPAARKTLKKEMKALMTQFEKLWMARNRRSEIRITLAAYRKVIDAL